ncbi:hypothetical protein F2Q68_00020177 [Brassica cretica]|uniref:Uncharacterized protein n=1 Tax=Brassica cretica TaxID=69181 RepID=A0A8S9FX83_BRACR|nr:hypothetical protein F2Q68_00020177 [Brassica cretica]
MGHGRKMIFFPDKDALQENSDILREKIIEFPRKFIFPQNFLGNFLRNSEETNFRGNSEDHQFVGKLLGIYRGRTSSGYFDGFSDGPILGSSDEMFLGIVIGNFRGTEPSENSEERVPRNIPRNESLGIFRGTCPSLSWRDWQKAYVETLKGTIP